MKKTFIFIVAFISAITMYSQAPFVGAPGIFVLGQTNVPLNETEFDKSYIQGSVVRVTWESIEPVPGASFDWDFIDGEILKAASKGKKISLAVLGFPSWINSYAPMHEYKETATGPTLTAPITWSTGFIARLSIMIDSLGNRYSNNPTVAYVNAVAGRINNNLPSIDGNGDDWWVTYEYDPELLLSAMKQVLDVYMVAFPNTPSWNSVENVSFEFGASGHDNKYVPEQFVNYGVLNYPDRFGVWREDISVCTDFTTETGHWSILVNNPCRNGAQTVWNVQDGPDADGFRMNNCDEPINTQVGIMEAVIQNGLEIGMRYLEIYKVDIDDADLTTVLTNGNNDLINQGNYCMPACISTAPSTCDAVTNTSVSGLIPWNLSNVTSTYPSSMSSDDNKFVTAKRSSTSPNSLTTELKISDFDFAIPSDASICGIEVTIKKKRSSGTIQDYSLFLLDSSGINVGKNMADLTTNWSTSETAITYGAPTNGWAAGLTPNDINSNGFGIAFQINIPTYSGSGSTASIESVSITIYYSQYDASLKSAFLQTSTIDHSTFADYSIYPNPSTSSVTIESPNDEVYNVKIMNVSGQIIYNGISNTKSTYVDVSSFENGIYIVQIESHGNLYNSKLIISK